MITKKYTVYWSKIAQDDLIEIIEYISLDSYNIAEDIFKKIKKQTIKLENFPERGRTVPELDFHNINNYRELIITPWRIIYRIEEHKVYILAVIDSRRNFEDIILKRLMRT
jgi:addiction module RelE/StbE family toxin